MRATVPVILFTCLLLAAPVFAQTAPDPDPAGQVMTPPPSGQTTTTTTTTTTTSGRDYDTLPNEFIVSGFVGGNFARSAVQSSVDFGGNLAYLHNSTFGAEFLAGFSPKFKLDRLAGGDADINNYMVNAIAAVPMGSFHAVRPFVSAGLGAITMKVNNVGNTNNAVFSPDETHFGGDVGVGLMAFTGGWGVRGDVRYFSALGTRGLITVNGVPDTPSTLDKASFWRANIGIAYRW